MLASSPSQQVNQKTSRFGNPTQLRIMSSRSSGPQPGGYDEAVRSAGGAQSFPPYQVWTYHSTNCDLILFFFPEVSGTAFRALTYQISERDASDATHTACLASLITLPAS